MKDYFKEDPTDDLRRYKNYLKLIYGNNINLSNITKEEHRKLKRLQGKASVKV
jgi:hypothetical protein